MKLELANGLIKKELFEELEIKNYFKIFESELDIPLLQHKILHFLDKKKYIEHFEDLNYLQKCFGNEILNKIISKSKTLPNLDKIIPLIKIGKLQPFQLYSIGNYLTIEKDILALEEKKEKNITNVLEIITLLEKYTENNFKDFRIPEIFSNLPIKIKIIENKIASLIKEYENEIYKQTKLKMLYPYPKELSNVELSKNKKIQKCELIKIKKQDNQDNQDIQNNNEDYSLIDYQLPKKIKNLLRNKEKITRDLSQFLDQRLFELNDELKKFYNDLGKNYYNRQKNIFFYYLIYCKEKYNLNFPSIIKDGEFRLKISDGVLPALKEKLLFKKEEYTPLNIEIKNGSNVLFGGNMSGKTTLIKTIYFLIAMTKLGLPIPCKEIFISHYPEEVFMHLPGHGNLQSGMSSFAEELSFFSQNFKENSIILVDELLNSTNPLSGTMLAKIFLEDFSNKNVIFFCSTHYLEVLSLNNISLYRMRDQNELIKGEVDKESESDFNHWAHNDLKKPLTLALNFSLSESIKNKIKISLEE
ncbi:MAG: hypothetical protein HQK51_00430 [Oligoflexia bacterium]|nr:hypothetical protein [Oligoflexia bacterium]